jgi:hypothetical protein
MDSDHWVAMFCPNCGCTLNEGDLDTDDPSLLRRKMAGQTYTCGWCHTRQTDWAHVKRCKATLVLRQQQALDRLEGDTIQLLHDLTRGPE